MRHADAVLAHGARPAAFCLMRCRRALQAFERVYDHNVIEGR